MIAADGFGGLYRGVSAPLVGVAPIFALSFAGNAAGQQMIRSATGHEKLSYGEFFLGGCIAGVYSTVIMAPGERIKVTSLTTPPKKLIFNYSVFSKQHQKENTPGWVIVLNSYGVKVVSQICTRVLF